MKRKYIIDISEVNGYKYIEMIFDDNKYDILSGLLNSNIVYISDKNTWIDTIDKVLKGNSKKEYIFLEAYNIIIEKESTNIEFEYSEDEVLEIETKEFKNILEIWFKNLEEFNKSGNIYGNFMKN